MFEKFKEHKTKVLSAGMFLATSLVTSPVFASEGGQSGAVVSALQSTASDITSTITSIAPVALSISGTFLVWRYGMKFFKSISK